MKKLSLIVPCYNEEESLPLFCDEIIKVMESLHGKYLWQVLLIDDGSIDKTLDFMRMISKKNTNFEYISFSRNFGKEAAMYAGFCNVSGDYVAIMDADMQDPPSLLPHMLQIIENEPYDSVATRRTNRTGEPIIRSFFAKKFYKLINKMSDADIVDGARDFRLMKFEMVEAIISMSECNRFSKGIFGWIGFRTYWLPYENVERIAGKTKWNFFKLLKYGIDGIISFSQVPLNIVSWFGIGMTITSFFFLLIIVARKIVFGDPVAGWASTISVIIFMGGIQMLCLGIMGQYIAKTYIETKNRPHYIISERSKTKT